MVVNTVPVNFKNRYSKLECLSLASIANCNTLAYWAHFVAMEKNQVLRIHYLALLLKIKR